MHMVAERMCQSGRTIEIAVKFKQLVRYFNYSLARLGSIVCDISIHYLM